MLEQANSFAARLREGMPQTDENKKAQVAARRRGHSEPSNVATAVIGQHTPVLAQADRIKVGSRCQTSGWDRPALTARGTMCGQQIGHEGYCCRKCMNAFHTGHVMGPDGVRATEHGWRDPQRRLGGARVEHRARNATPRSCRRCPRSRKPR